MPLIEKMIITMDSLGIGFELTSCLPFTPTINLKKLLYNKVHLFFYDNTNAFYGMINIENNLNITAGQTAHVKFVSEGIKLDPGAERDAWSHALPQLDGQVAEIIIKPVMTTGINKAIIAVELSICDPKSEYKRNKTIMDRGAVEVKNGRFHDGIVTINGLMRFYPPAP